MLMERMFRTLEQQSEDIKASKMELKERVTGQCATARQMVSIIRANLETAKVMGVKLDMKMLSTLSQKRLK